MSMVEVNGTELYVTESGPRDATALVFSHSLFFNADMFAAQVEHFSPDYRVVCYDNRGQGRSAPARLDQLDMDTLTHDAAMLIETLDLGRCHFLGNSMGGFIALRLAARRPDLVMSVVTLGSSGSPEGKVAEFAPLLEAMQASGAVAVIDPLMYIMFGDTSLGSPGRPDLTGPWREYMLGLGPSIGDCAHGVVYRKGVLDELAHATVPVLAMAGAEDHTYDVSLSEDIAAAAPQGRCVTVDCAGHSLALEAPSDVNAIIDDHLAQFRSAAASDS